MSWVIDQLITLAQLFGLLAAVFLILALLSDLWDGQLRRSHRINRENRND